MSAWPYAGARPDMGAFEYEITTPPLDDRILIAQDTFTRSVTDDWGTATPTGGAWTILSGAVGNFDVNGTQALLLHTPSNTTRAVYLQAITALDVEILWDIVIDKLVTSSDAPPASANGHVSVYMAMRAIADTDRYVARLLFRVDGNVDIALEKVVGGVGSTLAGAPASAVDVVAYGVNTRIHCRARVEGVSPSVVSAKLWLEGDPEPVDWTVTASDSQAVLQAAGDIGVRSFVGSTVTSVPHTLKFNELNAWAINTKAATGNVAMNTVARVVTTGRKNGKGASALSVAFGVNVTGLAATPVVGGRIAPVGPAAPTVGTWNREDAEAVDEDPDAPDDQYVALASGQVGKKSWRFPPLGFVMDATTDAQVMRAALRNPATVPYSYIVRVIEQVAGTWVTVTALPSTALAGGASVVAEVPFSKGDLTDETGDNLGIEVELL